MVNCSKNLQPIRCKSYRLCLYNKLYRLESETNITPDSKIPSKDTTKGALFTTFGVTIVTLIYSYYVANFSNYDIFYGGLTNIVIMMMWIYLISYIIVIGISINTHAYVEKDE